MIDPKTKIIKKTGFLTLILCCFISFLSANNIPLSDSAKVSILTSYPWDKEVYALFGHTAIRVSDKENDMDYVFNYGIFDFKSSNFIYRFAKGETDYIVSAYPFKYYLIEYQMREVAVFEQVLNLNTAEKQAVWDALCINVLPENRLYRYNFFFDNCATRPRDIIERNIYGTIKYTPTNKEQTFRDLVHECVNREPWTRFGIDLVIGSSADRIASDREKMFLPLYLKDAYSGAEIVTPDGKNCNFILNEYFILTGKGKELAQSIPDYPLLVGIGLFIATLLISIITYKKKNRILAKSYDFILFSCAGVAGCVIAFLMFVSEHPCTNPNWNIAWLNPLQLVAAFLFFIKYFTKYIYYYHFINFAVLSLFLLCWFIIPQKLEIAFIPFILSLWLRSGMNFVQYKKALR